MEYNGLFVWFYALRPSQQLWLCQDSVKKRLHCLCEDGIEKSVPWKAL